MSAMMTNPVKILISFDIKDDKPHKGLRLYTVNGVALGYGEMMVNEVKETNDLFTHLPGYISYSATIDLDKLQKKNGTVIKEIKVIDKDVLVTSDPDEDEWVAKSMQQLKEAKVTITLTTEVDLRDDYRKMKYAKMKMGEKQTEIVPPSPQVTAEIIAKRGETIFKQVEDDTNSELEPPLPPKPIVYTPIDDYFPLKAYRGDNGQLYLVENSAVTYTHEELKAKMEVQQLAAENLAKFHEPKAEQLPLSKELEPKKFNLDDFLKGI